MDVEDNCPFFFLLDFAAICPFQMRIPSWISKVLLDFWCVVAGFVTKDRFLIAGWQVVVQAQSRSYKAGSGIYWAVVSGCFMDVSFEAGMHMDRGIYTGMFYCFPDDTCMLIIFAGAYR